MRGKDAIIMAETGVPVGLIVMEIDPGPGICGIAASGKINSMSRIPILFFTSHSEHDITEKTGAIFSVISFIKKELFQKTL